MATRQGSFLDYLRPQARGDATALPPRLSAHAVRLGMVFVLVVFQLFFFLDSLFCASTVGCSPLLPGNWASLEPSFFYDILLDLFALGMIAALPRVLPGYNLRIQPGGFAGFGLTYVLFAIAAWGVTAALLVYSGGGLGGSVLNDTTRLQEFVNYGIFVGPSEELFFRVAFVPYAGWPISAGVVFALFHAFAYSTGPGGLTGVPFLVAMLEAGVLGIAFYFIFDRFGWGAAVATHTAYDLTVAGVIVFSSGLALHLALFPV
jgi:hypothetical protein